jgi:capsular exopolysaccharide synthesis family protein
VEISDYLRALRNHWVGAMLLTILVGATAFGFSLMQPKVYAANANGFVGTGASDNGALGSVNDQLAKSRATSYVDIAKSRATAQDVIDDLDLDSSPSALVGRIDVQQPLDTVLLKITARASTPREAQELADAWVRALALEVKEIEAPNSDKLPDGTPRVIPVESAELPTSPVSPRTDRNTALGIVLGALLGLGYAVLRSTLDRRLRTASDVESRFPVPVVGSIPTSTALRNRDTTDPTRTSYGTEDPSAGEAFRKLRTNLVYMDVDNPPRVLVVTSPKPGDGKSTVAANIAMTLESSGQKVILIDADLRRPMVADSFGLDPVVGLTSVLSGQLPIEVALRPVPGRDNMQVLTAGPLPPNPSELLGSKAMGSLIRSLAANGSYVILDAPPLLPVTDAAILATSADGAFVVVSSGKTLDTELGSALGSLEAVGARTLGVVINRTSAPGRGYGYYGYYAAADGKPDSGAASSAASPDPGTSSSDGKRAGARRATRR